MSNEGGEEYHASLTGSRQLKRLILAMLKINCHGKYVIASPCQATYDHAYVVMTNQRGAQAHRD